MKAAIKYQINYIKNMLLGYYGVFLLVIVFISSLMTVGSSNSSGSFSGMEFTSSIVILVAGITGFKENFLFFIQNGVSRKTIWKSRIISVLCMCGIVAAVDKILLNIAQLTISRQQIAFKGLFEMIYENAFSNMNAVTGFIVDFLLSFSLYLALSGLGYFIGILIYRLNKVGKVLVCVGAYTIPFIIVPLLDYWFFDMKLSAGFANMVSFLFGSDTGNPLPAILSFISIGIILFALCWLLIRKSVIGDKK